jgi:hypothetical protein
VTKDIEIAREWLMEIANLLGDIQRNDVVALETLADGLRALEKQQKETTK